MCHVRFIFKFEDWQLALANMNIQSKFLVSTMSYGKEILMPQVNLLLSASTMHEIAGAMIHRHYAQRAFPDDGLHFGLPKPDAPWGGWLYVAPKRYRCLGHALMTTPRETDPQDMLKASNWQVAVFQTMVRDPILYLASCWSQGYFSIASSLPEAESLTFTALTVVNNLWKPDTFDGINFQNPVAYINTGARLEVVVTLSIMNAGAMHTNPRMQFVVFFENVLKQLDIVNPHMIDIQQDLAFQDLRLIVPHWSFPVIGDATQPLSNIGMVHRTTNASQHDATLHNVQGRNTMGVKVGSIKFEMKD